MITTIHRADVLQSYIDSGLDPTAAIRKLKADAPEYVPNHRNAQGDPLTFEAVVSDNIRKHHMTPDVAIRAATTSDPRMQRDYYERLRVGAVGNLEWILKGNQI
jgi:hypothetical protein